MTSPNFFFAPSPTVALQTNPDQYFAKTHYTAQNQQPIANVFTGAFTPTATDSIPPTPGSLAGRKRSRGNIHAPEDDDIMPDGSLPTPVSEAPPSRGNASINWDANYSFTMASESQSRQWSEELSERKQFQLDSLNRPMAKSRKSQRMTAAIDGDSDDLAQLLLPSSMRQSTIEPLIDEATRSLGISWIRMDKTEALRISRKAYIKWITNHYPSLADVVVWFENSAIPGYLVAATNVYNGLQEYYIFSQDLTEARLVTREPADLVPRLLLLPALHLAAPGGCIRAQETSVTALATENDSDRGAQDDEHMQSENQPIGLCGAHEMEMD